MCINTGEISHRHGYGGVAERLECCESRGFVLKSQVRTLFFIYKHTQCSNVYQIFKLRTMLKAYNTFCLQGITSEISCENPHMKPHVKCHNMKCSKTHGFT